MLLNCSYLSLSVCVYDQECLKGLDATFLQYFKDYKSTPSVKGFLKNLCYFTSLYFVLKKNCICLVSLEINSICENYR